MLSRKLQRLGVASIASILLLGGSVFPAFAENGVNQNTTVKAAKYVKVNQMKYQSFEEFMKNDVKKKDVKENDIEELKTLYYKAMDFKKAGKINAVDEVMKSFFKISDEYEDLYVSNYVKHIKITYPSFEGFMKNDVKKKDVKENDIEELKTLYYKAIDLKKSGKINAADEVMKSFYKITDEYEDLYVNNYVRHIKTTYPTFEEFMMNDVKKEGVSEADINKLKGIYYKAIEFKKIGEFKEAKEVMNKFYKITDKYQDIYIRQAI